MSFELTQKVIRNRLNINLYEKLLLAIIADKIDHKGFCYPSYSTLANISGCCRRQVIRSIKNLANHNLITIKKITGKGNHYSIDEKVLDNSIKHAKKKRVTSVTQSLALVPESHPTSATQSPDQCHTVTLVTKVVDKEVNKGSKVISKNKITEPKLPVGTDYWVEEEMKIEDIDLAKFEKTNKKKMNPIDIWRNAVVDFQNEHLLAIVDLKFTQVQAGIMNKAAKKLEGGFKDSLEYAVWNWGEFVKYVNLHAGDSKKPVSPKMNFFVYHSNLALQFYQEKSDTKVKPKKLNVGKKIKPVGKVTDPYTKALMKAAGKKVGN